MGYLLYIRMIVKQKKESTHTKREQRYTVTPNPTTADADDDFGFNETVSFFQDAKSFDPSTGTDKTSTND